MRSIIDRPALLLGLGAILAVAAFHLWITPSNPPGYHRDEAALSLNAYTLSTSLRDEDGARLPLFFRSFDDYKSPVYPYVLAAVFKLTGPNAQVARGLSAVLVLAAVLLLGVLARRLTESWVVAAVVVVLAGMTPWLFELGRMAIEATTQPLFLVLLLLWLERACRLERYGVAQGIGAGVLIGLITYSYTGSRLLGPLLAFALVVFAGRGRWRFVLSAWVTLLVALVPLGVYAIRHPGNLTARYEATTIARDGLSGPRVALQAIGNWFRDFSPWHWATAGDPAPYIHNGGYGALFAAVVLLALVGAALVLLRRRDELWWRYVLVATLVVPIPAALTVDRHNAIRLAMLPVLLLVLAIPALAALLAALKTSWWARAAAAALAIAIGAQFAQFMDSYRTRGPARVVLFEAGVEPLLEGPLASGETIYVDFDDRGAHAQARWRAAEADVPQSRVVILPDGGIPPPAPSSSSGSRTVTTSARRSRTGRSTGSCARPGSECALAPAPRALRGRRRVGVSALDLAEQSARILPGRGGARVQRAHDRVRGSRRVRGALSLYFSSFLDYKSPIFVYSLAGVFLVTGADREVARGFAAVCMLAAILLLGWLAYRRTGRASVGVAIVALAGCSPWLFELGRVAFEVAMEPLFLCLALLGVERASRLDRWSPVTALPVSAALGAITYVYAGGRLLAPLLAGALVVLVGRGRWKWVLTAWVGFLVTQVPLLAYTRIHPGALSRRFDATTFVTDDMPIWEIGWRAAVNYLQDLQLWHYVVSGDVKPYAHTPGAGALLAASLVLSLAGLVLVLARHRSDPFWRFAVAALAVSLVPAAFTIDRFHAVRLAPFAVMLVVVAIPAVEALREAAARAAWARALAAALVAGALLQFGFFVHNYRTDGPLRTGRFEAGIPQLLDQRLGERRHRLHRLRRPGTAGSRALVRAREGHRSVTRGSTARRRNPADGDDRLRASPGVRLRLRAARRVGRLLDRARGGPEADLGGLGENTVRSQRVWRPTIGVRACE